MSSQPAFAFLGRGNLFLCDPAGAVRQVESPFAGQVQQRHEEIAKRHAWKSEGRGARFMMGGMAWEMPGADAGAQAPVILSLSRGGKASELIYGLRVAGVNGLCSLDVVAERELRLVHQQDAFPGDLAFREGVAFIACIVPRRDGSASLAVMDPDGGHLRELTEGDSLEGAPSWVEGSGERIVFQSQGIGRDGQGNFAAVGPSEIQALDVRSGELQVLLQDSARDFLAPQMTADGTLYCIRRPYQAAEARSFGAFLQDLLGAPFRLIGAIFQYLNLFSAT